MIIDSQKTLRVGQVLEGLLDDDAVAEPRREAAAQPSTSAAGSRPVRSVALWERMLAAVALKFDADNDGDVRGEG
jgi:hypothetical protein